MGRELIRVLISTPTFVNYHNADIKINIESNIVLELGTNYELYYRKPNVKRYL